MYRVITIEREFGSGAAEIAAALADHLHWKLWDQALTQEIANVAQVDPSAVMCCDERRDSTFHRLAKTFWRGSYQRSMELNTAAPFDTDRFVAISEQVLRKVASTGNCVIVGRGAPYFLRERPDVFHVFLYAPRAEKLRRIQSLGRSLADAEDLVDTVDRERILFVKHYFGADWPTRSLYQVMINTAIGNQTVLSTILNTMHSLEHVPA